MDLLLDVTGTDATTVILRGLFALVLTLSAVALWRRRAAANVAPAALAVALFAGSVASVFVTCDTRQAEASPGVLPGYTPRLSGLDLPVYATPAALTAASSSRLTTGALAWVTNQGIWIYQAGACPCTTDGATCVLAQSGPSCWSRDTSTYYGANDQTTWFINPSSGSDSANGSTSGTALATWAEYRRRVGALPVVSSTVNVLGNLPASDPMRPPYVPDGSHVVITGALGTTTLATASVTATTTVNRATNTPNNITASGLSGNWSALGLINQRGRVTSGARAGTVFWAAKDTGTKSARISQPTGQSPIDTQTQVVLQNGDPFVVETLPSVADLIFDEPVSNIFSSGLNLTVSNLDLSQIAGVVPEAINGVFGAIVFGGCNMGSIEGSHQDFGCQYPDFFSAYIGNKTISAGLMQGDVQLYPGGVIYASTGTISQGGGAWMISPGAVLIGGGLDLGVFDSSGDGIDSYGLVSDVDTLWGSGNTGFGLRGFPQSWMTFNAAPTITGTSGNVNLGGDTQTWAGIATNGYTSASLASALPNAGTTVQATMPLTSSQVTTALGFTPVTNARTIATTAPLTGGGALTGNLTLALSAGVSRAFQWGAQASATATGTQLLPPGSGAATLTADTTLGWLAPSAGTLSAWYLQYAGSALNVAGQTLTCTMTKINAGGSTTMATIPTLATTTGVQRANTTTFASASYAAGDDITVTCATSAILTSALTDLLAGAQ